MNNQPLFNIGCLGSVSDGKSTLVEKLTNIKTQKHSSEKYRNITIKQGYANMKIWSDMTTTNDIDINKELINHISFVDCPGHQDLIHVALSSISLMDGAIVVIAVDQPITQKPQLIQHLLAIKLGNINKFIICMNKIDLVSKETLLIRKKELDILLQKYKIEPFAIIPTCFNKKLGLNYLIELIMLLFNPKKYEYRNELKTIFNISRSFDINKPGTNWNLIEGGVIGGSLESGTLKVGDLIEIKPGYKNISIKTKVISIQTDKNKLNIAYPGGLIGIKTDIDPYYCKNDLLSGNICGLIDNIPCIYNEININISTLSEFDFIWNPKINDNVMLQINIKMISAVLINIENKKFTFKLKKDVCINDNQHIIICYTINNILRIVGDGKFYL
jgi:translation initiation factor 2 subunit 3